MPRLSYVDDDLCLVSKAVHKMHRLLSLWFCVYFDADLDHDRS